MGCFFRDPITDASALNLDTDTRTNRDGAEEGTSHIGLHLAEEGHAYGRFRANAACDMVHGTLFCSACDDVVYDPRFEYVRRTEQRRTTVQHADESVLDAVLTGDALCTYAA